MRALLSPDAGRAATVDATARRDDGLGTLRRLTRLGPARVGLRDRIGSGVRDLGRLARSVRGIWERRARDFGGRESSQMTHETGARSSAPAPRAPWRAPSA